MDQTNPLAEVTQTSSFCLRSWWSFLANVQVSKSVMFIIHTMISLCPIESPEGPNIGLISSLCLYAKINDLGFIVTPIERLLIRK